MATAAPARPPAESVSLDTRFFGHPRGLSTLFFTEMWERFSYYGMRALLILFMTAPVAAGGLRLRHGEGRADLRALTCAGVPASLPGGWVADRLLGLRRAVFIGGVLIMVGAHLPGGPVARDVLPGPGPDRRRHGSAQAQHRGIVGQLYRQDDPRRDAGYSIFYMGINTGAFVAPLVTGWLAQSEAFRGFLGHMGIHPESTWHWGFGAAAVGMFLGLVQYALGGKYLARRRGSGPSPADPAAAAKAERQVRTVGMVTVAVLLVGGLLMGPACSGSTPRPSRSIQVGADRGDGRVFRLAVPRRRVEPEERKRLLLITVLFVASCIFWMAYEQAGSTLNLFAERNTDNTVLGHAFPASWYQALTPMFIILFAPVFAVLWTRLGRRIPQPHQVRDRALLAGPRLRRDDRRGGRSRPPERG